MSLPPGYTLRAATPADAALIAWQREAMFVEMGMEYSEAVAQFAPWAEARIGQGVYLGWLVEQHGQPVAGVGLMIFDWPPHTLDPQPLRAYLMNVYTDPAHRGHGLARHLTQQAIEETRARHIRILSLHASEFGRPLYETLGFQNTNEMRLTLPAEVSA